MSDRQYVIFKLGDEKYGVEISNVGESLSFHLSLKYQTHLRILRVLSSQRDIIPIINLKTRLTSHRLLKC